MTDIITPIEVVRIAFAVTAVVLVLFPIVVALWRANHLRRRVGWSEDATVMNKAKVYARFVYHETVWANVIEYMAKGGVVTFVASVLGTVFVVGAWVIVT